MTINSKSVKGIKKPDQILKNEEITLLKHLNFIAVGVLRRKPADFVEYISKKEINHKVIKTINTTIRVIESKHKKEILDDLINENREKGIHFYIASKHDDSASDHVDYQGKIYVDKNAKLTDADREYLRNHKVMSIQAVTNKPIWFVTRPYCRHYFKPVETEKLLSGNYYVPHTPVGDYKLQTKPTAQVSLDYYRDRLKLYENLMKVHPTDDLQKRIYKTKVLIAKWKRII